MGTAIVVTSGKGGTGKTSLTAGVASCLTALGKSVLCVDMDIGLRNLDLALGMTDRALMDFTDVIEGRCTLAQGAVPHPQLNGLFLLTAPVSFDRVPSQAEMDTFWTQAKSAFDYVLIDSPAGVGLGFHLAASGADRAIVVSTNENASLRDAQRAVSELAVSRIHLVVNRVQPKLLRKLRRSIDDAMNAAGLPLLGVVPEDSAVMLAANTDTPLILTHHKGAAIAYLNIAKRVEGYRVPIMRIR